MTVNPGRALKQMLPGSRAAPWVSSPVSAAPAHSRPALCVERFTLVGPTIVQLNQIAVDVHRGVIYGVLTGSGVRRFTYPGLVAMDSGGFWRSGPLYGLGIDAAGFLFIQNTATDNVDKVDPDTNSVVAGGFSGVPGTGTIAWGQVAPPAGAVSGGAVFHYALDVASSWAERYSVHVGDSSIEEFTATNYFAGSGSGSTQVAVQTLTEAPGGFFLTHQNGGIMWLVHRVPVDTTASMTTFGPVPLHSSRFVPAIARCDGSCYAWTGLAPGSHDLTSGTSSTDYANTAAESLRKITFTGPKVITVADTSYAPQGADVYSTSYRDLTTGKTYVYTQDGFTAAYVYELTDCC